MSRAAAPTHLPRSNIHLLTRMGAEVTLIGPRTLLPPEFKNYGVRICHNLMEGLRGADVINILRIQMERMDKNFFPSIREYKLLYGISSDRVNEAAPDALIMHPGPVNRGVEIEADVADGPNSAISEQVTNGIAVRMTVLHLLRQPDALT